MVAPGSFFSFARSEGFVVTPINKAHFNPLFNLFYVGCIDKKFHAIFLRYFKLFQPGKCQFEPQVVVFTTPLPEEFHIIFLQIGKNCNCFLVALLKK